MALFGGMLKPLHLTNNNRKRQIFREGETQSYGTP